MLGYTVQTPKGHTESSSYSTGTEPILLVAIHFNLLLYGLRSLKEDILVTTDKNLIIVSIDYDLVDRKVFWTDLGVGSIKWISMDTRKKGTVVEGVSLCVGQVFIWPLPNARSMENKRVAVNVLNVGLIIRSLSGKYPAM